MPVTLPKSDDVRKAREQANSVVAGAFEQARTPLLAVLGAGDLAAQAINDALLKAREELDERTQSARKTATSLPTELDELRKNFDANVLRQKLDPAELRRVVDEYAKAAVNVYESLAGQGEKTLDKLRNTPQVKQALEQVGSTFDAAQHRVEDAVDDAHQVADDVLGKVTRRTRSAGEKTARTVEGVAEDVAAKVDETGDAVVTDIKQAGEDAAKATRSTARKTANRTAPAAKKPAAAPATPKSTDKTDKTDKADS